MIRTLYKDQVWDDKGCFYVGLKRTKKRYKGLPVYEDSAGVQLVIVGGEA